MRERLPVFNSRPRGPRGGPLFASAPRGDDLLVIPFDTGFQALSAPGSGVPTFARALPAYVPDFELMLKLAKSGEGRIEGRRRVANLYTTATSSIAIAGTITYTNPGPTSIFVFSMGPGSGTATFSGTSGASGTLAADPTRRTAVTKTLPAGTIIVTASVGALIDVQLELVSGQTNQNPSEYVSVGVAAAPLYHGAMSDGVRYFRWQNGNTVASNIVTEAQGAVISGARTGMGYYREAAATQLLLQSDNLNNAAWTFPRTTVASNTVAGPHGLNVADQLTANATDVAGAPHSQAVTLVASTQYTLSAFVKRVSGTTKWMLLSLTDGTNEQGVYVDVSDITTGGAVNGSALSTGTGFTNVVRHTPVSYFNGWWQIAITMTIAATTACTAKLTIVDADASTSVTSGASRLAWNIQLEAGPRPTSAMVSAAATVTRPLDALSYPEGDNVSSSKGMAYAETTMVPNSLADGGNHTVLGSGGTAKLVYGNTTNGKVFTTDGTNTASVEGSSFYTFSPVSVASTWGGSALTAYGSGSPGTPTAFDGGMGTGVIDVGAGNFCGTIKQVTVAKRQFTTAEVVDISIGNISFNQISQTVIRVQVPMPGAPTPLTVFEIEFQKQPSSFVWWMAHVIVKDLKGIAADIELTYAGTSVWEYARQIGEAIETDTSSGVTYDFYGAGHGYEDRQTLSIKVDGVAVALSTVAPWASATGSSIVIEQTMNILKPRTVLGIIPPGTVIGNGTLKHSIDSTEVLVDHTHTITAAGLKQRPAYAGMLAVEPTKFNKAQAGAQAAVTITAPAVDTVIATGLTETSFKVFHTNTAINPYQITMQLPYLRPELSRPWALVIAPQGFFLDNPLRFKGYLPDVGDAGEDCVPGVTTVHRTSYRFLYAP